MQRSKVIRSLFWELRAAGVEGSAKDVLRLAHFIMRSHLGEVGRADDFGRVVDPRALPFLPVDVVMADGGWRLLEFENSRASYVERDAVDENALRKRVKRLMTRR
ncbi:MAG TPA: hypothetical protein VEZ41_04375 [Allosphingosinicella sp.]|nr:hypothetical protein [Allosphingosinicella sp.]